VAWSRTRAGLASGEYHSLESTIQTLLEYVVAVYIALPDREQILNDRNPKSPRPSGLGSDAGLNPATALRSAWDQKASERPEWAGSSGAKCL